MYCKTLPINLNRDFCDRFSFGVQDVLKSFIGTTIKTEEAGALGWARNFGTLALWILAMSCQSVNCTSSLKFSPCGNRNCEHGFSLNNVLWDTLVSYPRFVFPPSDSPVTIGERNSLSPIKACWASCKKVSEWEECIGEEGEGTETRSGGHPAFKSSGLSRSWRWKQRR